MKSLPLFDPPKPRIPIPELNQKMRLCQLCPLSETRCRVVYGQGRPNADMLFLGEAPGETEDYNGITFSGKAGGLLDDLFEELSIHRDDVFIANTIKCRPPRNRKPYPDEVDACKPYLEEQINSVRPRVIVALGGSATSWLIGEIKTMGEVRGKLWTYDGYRVIPTYHPAYLLRSERPEDREKFLKDVRFAKGLL